MQKYTPSLKSLHHVQPEAHQKKRARPENHARVPAGIANSRCSGSRAKKAPPTPPLQTDATRNTFKNNMLSSIL